jgi:hypothetical protein
MELFKNIRSFVKSKKFKEADLGNCLKLMWTIVSYKSHPVKPTTPLKNVKDRLAFAKSHQHWTIQDWRKVIFSDETKINRFNSDGRKWTWCRDDSSLSPRCVSQTVKHGEAILKFGAV